MRNEIPILYERKEDCCGCTACYAICPQKAIKMQKDEEGFEYPYINEELCIKCHMCLKVCPIKKQNTIEFRVDIRTYGEKNENNGVI